jgi:hypothetical protein
MKDTDQIAKGRAAKPQTAPTRAIGVVLLPRNSVLNICPDASV